MIISKLKITKAKLESIPENERIFFLQIMNLLNDINVLQKQVLFALNEKAENKVIESTKNYLAIFNQMILAGKLCEGWEMLGKDFFGAKLAKDFESDLAKSEDLDQGKKALDFLKNYFNGSSLIRKIRNKYAFHYDKEEVKKRLSGVSDNEFELYFSKSSGNCFSTTSHIFIESLLKSECSDLKEGLEGFFRDTIDVTKNFQGFIFACLVLIKEKHFDDEDLEKVEIPDPLKLEEVCLPFFVADREVAD